MSEVPQKVVYQEQKWVLEATCLAPRNSVKILKETPPAKIVAQLVATKIYPQGALSGCARYDKF